jgi:hypothetical protein
MMRMALIAMALVFGAGSAQADNCGKSRDTLFGSLSDLPLPPKAYEDLLRVCMAAAAMTNVRDAYILKDGGIAVIARQDSVAATAATLSQFCDAYPKATLHFLTRNELLKITSITSVVRISSTSSTSCQKIKGTT